MPAMIQVERDRDGLQQAVRALFEEAPILHRIESTMLNADRETRDRAAADIPPRELSPGYFTRAGYLLDLSTTLELGVTLPPESFTRSDVDGLAAVRAAKADYEREHPGCPSCGERQDTRHMKQCFKCHAKMPGGGH